MAKPMYRHDCNQCTHLGTEEVEGKIMDFYLHDDQRRFSEPMCVVRFDNAHGSTYTISVRTAEYLATFNCQPYWKTVVRLLAQHKGEA